MPMQRTKNRAAFPGTNQHRPGGSLPLMGGVKCMHVTEVPVENCRNPVSTDRMRIENDMADDRAIRLYRGRMSRTCIHYMCLRVSYL